MNTSTSIKIDFRMVSALLLIIILIMLGLWRPWQHRTNVERKISVSGSTTIQATPDQYQFSPSYKSTATDHAAAQTELAGRSDQIVSELKKLGVKDEQIKNNINDFTYDVQTGGTNTTLQLTITVTNKSLAQKVQDYLLTTGPTGEITPYVSFSASKEKQLESQARGQALSDARSKAQQTADRLGAHLGKVLSVSDQNTGGIIPLARGLAQSTDTKAQSLTLQPGQNEFNFTVNAAFAID